MSTTTSAADDAWTVSPADETATITVAERVWPRASLLTVDVGGSASPDGNAVANPGPAVLVIVTLTATATVSTGTPGSGITSLPPACTCVPNRRVSAIRAGPNGTKRPLVEAVAGTKPPVTST